ncbi:thioredoxin family protein [Jhaorihella thermophila]
MILWEQRGCPYCRELHRINFRRDDIVSYLKKHYVVLQLNLWGDREVTDFDGEVLSEKQIAKKWHVNFTPTVILINGRDAGAKSMREAEAFRMPGYFKPFHFLAGLLSSPPATPIAISTSSASCRKRPTTCATRASRSLSGTDLPLLSGPPIPPPEAGAAGAPSNRCRAAGAAA